MLLLPFADLVAVCGWQSRGEFLLGKETPDTAAAHRILRDFFGGKPVSAARMRKLFNAIMDHGQRTGVIRERPELPGFLETDEPFQGDGGYTDDLTLWGGLLPVFNASPTLGPTLTALLNASHFLHDTVQAGGAGALARQLDRSPQYRDTVARLADHLSQNTATLHQVSKALGILGVFMLILAHIKDTAANPQEAGTTARRLFCLDDDESGPQRAFARWIERRCMQDLGLSKAEVIRAAFGTSDTAKRQAHKYFSAEEVPPWRTAAKVLKLRPADNGEARVGLWCSLTVARCWAEACRLELPGGADGIYRRTLEEMTRLDGGSVA